MRYRNVLLAVFLGGFALPGDLAAQAGDAEYGEQLLRMRGCQNCHAGGGPAKDLSARPGGLFSPDALAASLWNHAPRMWEAMEQREMPLVGLREGDIANLYAYFYSLGHFDPEGDAGRGQRVFEEKGCAGCHRLEPPAATGEKADPDAAPPVDQWVAGLDPTLWIESMWNHGATMADRMPSGGWPRFELQEMIDLIEFVETRPPHAGMMPYLRMGDWFAGRHDFSALGCAQCHTLGEPADGKIDLLDAARRQPLLSGLAVEMWNHREAMAAKAEAMGMELPVFQPDQMANVLAYLFREGYFQTQGDAQRGRKAYESLGCAECHDGGDSGAPMIGNEPTPFSAVRLASAVWTHGPNMKLQVDYLEKEWPELTEQHVADIVAYIRER